MTQDPLSPLFGPYGRGALAQAERLPDHGVNAVWFHMFDPEAFALCQRHGLAACVEFKTFRADFDAHPDLIPTGVDGRPIRYGRLVQGVCLSREWFLAETEETLRQGVAAHEPAGIWLDYLSYAGWFETPQPDLQDHCFCADCIAEFCRATEIDATSPREILDHHRPAWTRHRCQRIAAWGRRFADIIRARLPDCVIGAYMCPWAPSEFDGALTRIFAQDYDRLAPSVDVFTPLIYAQKSGRDPAWAGRWLAAAPEFVPPGRRVQLILDVLDFPASLEATAAAPDPGWGVQIFGGAQIFEDEGRATRFRELVGKMRSRLDG